MRNIIKLYILMMTIFILLIKGNTHSEIKYYSNPHVLKFQETNDNTEIGDYQLSIVDDKLIINAKNKEFEVSLPDNYSNIQSFHLSYDKRFLAYDVAVESGIKIFVVNLESGEMINLSDTIGYQSDYDGYQSPFGIAWAPNKNLIAFICGNYGAARIDMYHFEMAESMQATHASEVFENEDVYGVKWDSTGGSIYYLIDYKIINMYKLYQTEIRLPNNYLYAGTIRVITEKKGINNWLNKEDRKE
ncbi:hypothetical protein LSPCS325_52050 [Lysinibacillus sp. CTST325]